MSEPAVSPAPAGPGPRPEPLRIDVLTIFPPVVEHYAAASILGRATGRGLLDLRVHDLRSAASDPHRSVDDAPFGGGPGMVLAPEPVFGAVEQVAQGPGGLPRPLLLLSPSGRRFDQGVAEDLAGSAGFSLLCGRYEGVDQRIADHLVDGELSIGDIVLAGGELAALVVVEAVARLVPGVLGNDDSAGDESFADGLLEYPQYTRPAEFRGLGGARGAPLRRPRAHRPLAAGQVAGRHPRTPPRPGRGPGRAHPRRGRAAGRPR